MSFLYKTLVVGGLLLCLCIPVFGQALQQRISVDFKGVSLQTALEQISTEHGLNFSYLNNDLPGETNVSLQLKDVPLQEVLASLLASTRLGYAEHNGQIIISKSLPRQKPATLPASAPTKPEVQQKTPEPTQEPETTAPQPDSEPENRYESNLPAPVSSVEIAATPAPGEAQALEDSLPKKVPSRSLYASIEKTIFSKLETEETPQTNPVHVGIIYPLSNLGEASRQSINRFSLHLLIGYNAGLEGFEASSIGNVENNYVKGAQFAGIFNVVNGSVRGVQASGFTNFSGDSVHGAQLGGFSNFTKKHLRGLQSAGFGNLAGSIYGFQIAGFGNIVGNIQGTQLGGFGNIANQVRGTQFSSFGNIADTVVRGTQFGGFGNIAGNARGLQAGGFGNIAHKINGVQLAGFINIAGQVKGLQLGFINFADSMQGVPIGFLSIVKKGHRSLEVWTGDAFEANLAFKTGVERFYNIFAAASQVQEPYRWGLGYGFGSQWRLHNRLRLNTDVMSFHVFEEGFSESWNNEFGLNQLSKFRLLAGWKFARRFSIFAGPAYNVMVSQYKNAEGNIGSQLPTHSFYDKTFSGRTNVKMWIGFNAGVRF